MSQHPITCDFGLLRLSLDERLDERQEEQLARHLAECEACQRELERLAGQQEEWSKVSLALQQEAVGRSSKAIRNPTDKSGSEQHNGPADSTSVDEVHDDSLADFAVDFLSPSSAPDAIGRIGEVDILEVIGRGGMGVVLKGYQPELKRLVAVKVLAPHLAVSGPARQRFAREAQATAAILHPNVVPILTVHSTGKLPYLVMPFLACESLQQRVTRQGALDLVDVLRIGMQTAQGLAAAHAQGIVHRDVKPANILLEKGVDRVMLTDFGLARAIDDASITRTGLIAGTPQYMSPEQARGEALDARSDLFSLGSVLYTMATGRPPFRAESTYGILRRITDDRPRSIREINPQIPDWLVVIIDKLLAKRPEDRFATAAEVATVLEQCLAHVQQPAVVSLPRFCGRRGLWQRRAGRVSVIVGGLLVIVVASLLWNWQLGGVRTGTSTNVGADAGSIHYVADAASVGEKPRRSPVTNTTKNVGADAGSIHYVADAASVGEKPRRSPVTNTTKNVSADAGSIHYVADAASVGEKPRRSPVADATKNIGPDAGSILHVPTPATTQLPPDDPALKWNSVAETLDELEHDGLPFESRVDLLWDREPLLLTPDSSPNVKSPPETELQP